MLYEVITLSDYRLQGTARATAMGNAFGSLGGDFTSASINPAGLGLYRSSEFVFTPMFGKTEVDGSYLGRTMTDSKYNVSVPNIGYVANFNSNSNSQSGLVSVSFGIGYNRMNNFNLEKLVEGEGAKSSLLDGFTDNAEKGIWSDYYEELAWQTYLLNYDEDADRYWNDFSESGYNHSQRKTFSQRGSVDEYVLSLAANFNHKFYVGGTIGIHDVYFKETTSLYEYDLKYNVLPESYLRDYYFDTFLRTTGTGFNIKLGAIFKPVDALRLGFAFHSPTFYDLHDAYDNKMYSYIYFPDELFHDELKDFYDDSPYGDYDYKLETPMKAIFSAAYVIGKAGLRNNFV